MVSVLLAVYNGEKYLKKSIESVLYQTYVDFELLIGFNGTVDSSPQIAASFDDPRIKMFTYDEPSKSKTLNKLLQEAEGEWCAIQDDDDIWLPKKLSKQMEIVEKGEFDVIGTNVFYCNEVETVTGGPNISTEHEQIVSRSMQGDNQVLNTTTIFKTSDAKEVGGWDENLSGIEDFDFWLKLMKKECRFINFKKQFVLHRIHQNSNFNTKQYNIQELIKKYKDVN